MALSHRQQTAPQPAPPLVDDDPDLDGFDDLDDLDPGGRDDLAGFDDLDDLDSDALDWLHQRGLDDEGGRGDAA